MANCSRSGKRGKLMGLISRLDAQKPWETWPLLDLAAWERYWDGLELATGTAGRKVGAIYLFGYAVEILLKVAFFRQQDWSPSQPIDRNVISNHANWRKKSTLHDLKALASLLIAERKQRGKPYDPVFAGVLNIHVDVLVLHWRETLRYWHGTASEKEVNEVLQSIEWILNNCNKL